MIANKIRRYKYLSSNSIEIFVFKRCKCNPGVVLLWSTTLVQESNCQLNTRARLFLLDRSTCSTKTPTNADYLYFVETNILGLMSFKIKFDLSRRCECKTTKAPSEDFAKGHEIDLDSILKTCFDLCILNHVHICRVKHSCPASLHMLNMAHHAYGAVLTDRFKYIPDALVQPSSHTRLKTIVQVVFTHGSPRYFQRETWLHREGDL